jgi:hypothetical protein
MENTLRQLQDDFHAALLRGDAGVLDSMVADECRIIGPKGYFIDRDEWIGTHKDSDYEQVRLESRDVELRMYGNTAIRWEGSGLALRLQGRDHRRPLPCRAGLGPADGHPPVAAGHHAVHATAAVGGEQTPAVV